MLPNLEYLSDSLQSVSSTRQDFLKPPYCGEIDIRIDTNGVWYYMGSPILRDSMVGFFASILRKEDAEYFLVTAMEKVKIQVDDVPFLIVDVEGCSDISGNQDLYVTTNIGNCFKIDASHGLSFHKADNNLDITNGVSMAYVEVKDDLQARFDRKSYYRLIDLGEEVTRGDSLKWFGLRSGGVFFPIAESMKLM